MTIKGFAASKLITAIRAGSLIGVVEALDDQVDIEEPDMHGSRGLPLRTACFEGNLAIVRELLTHGANPNAAASDGPGAPLRLALRRKHNEIAALLLQQGAVIPDDLSIDPSIFDITGELPPLEALVPSLPDAEPDNNIIEFTRSEITPATSINDDAPDAFGTETNALSMDLMFLDEHEALDFSKPEPKKPD
ncbi:MAG: Ankyrin [Proteobacteria bacterium]|nr:Ankyrin [Pseudomonadota bacterium]